MFAPVRPSESIRRRQCTNRSVVVHEHLGEFIAPPGCAGKDSAGNYHR
jgi:hypothetical protein